MTTKEQQSYILNESCDSQDTMDWKPIYSYILDGEWVECTSLPMVHIDPVYMIGTVAGELSEWFKSPRKYPTPNP